jgi:NAD(P)H dehydrogenase (quinone)
MKVLIVHAHPETKSFSTALAKTAADTLRAAGHSVMVSDLYAQGFNPVSDRRNFTTAKDREYYKQQAEEAYASERGGFSLEVEAEIQKLEWCDLLIFSFPLWWFGMPAILKGWVDRAVPYGRIYGLSKIYERGLGQARRRALVLMTTGGVENAYSGRGVNPALQTILTPIQHGIFWFNGFQPLSPFVAWHVAHGSDDDRRLILQQLRDRLSRIFDESPLVLPPLGDFPSYGDLDAKKRFLVTVTRKSQPDDAYRALLSAEKTRIAELRRLGFITNTAFSAKDESNWCAFLEVRSPSREDAERELQTLPLAPRLNFDLTEIQ